VITGARAARELIEQSCADSAARRKVFSLLRKRSHCQLARSLITLSATEARDDDERCFAVDMRSAASRALVFVSLSMQRQLAAFVEQPSRATFLAARDAVLCLSPLPLAASDVAELQELFEREAYDALLDRLDALPPSKVLSPSIHYLAAEAAAARGDDAEVELERSLFVITLQGLLATGDGTAANPYIVCHCTDEYDLLAALGLETAGQSLVEQGGRMCDVIRCTSGREVWFDVTDLIAPRDQKHKVRGKRRRAPRRRLRISRQFG
jgi:hypothetical protein